ncbi:MAG TPA: type II toxin-antitoxin system HicB family antitoxin [Niallia sp.]|nr:type II toxin-antitoxin system HicB family antitoxin [Niallia sp.]
MPVYKYYAVIEKEKLDDSGAYIVSFPDIENVFTDGETLIEANTNAEDVLGLVLTDMEDSGDYIPVSSKAKDIKLLEGASLVLIEVDTEKYRETV